MLQFERLRTAWHERAPFLSFTLHRTVRRRSAALGLLGVVGLAAAAASIAVAAMTLAARSNALGAANGRMGIGLYVVTTSLLGVAAMLITPLLACEGLSRQRDSKTYDLLRGSQMPTWQRVAAAPLAALAYGGLLALALLPFFIVAIGLGGVGLTVVVLTYWIFVLAALLFTAIATAASAIASSTLVARLITLGALTAVIIGAAVAMLIMATTLVTLARGLPIQPGGAAPDMNAQGAARAGLIFLSASNPISTLVTLVTATSAGEPWLTVTFGPGTSSLDRWLAPIFWYSLQYPILTGLAWLLALRRANRLDP
ncbi:MAG: hypothetical protein K1X39_06700 [Thermoflexales bacterium]|nr:hypothetical protein [Thermoflexales bacterium]